MGFYHKGSGVSDTYKPVGQNVSERGAPRVRRQARLRKRSR